MFGCSASPAPTQPLPLALPSANDARATQVEALLDAGRVLGEQHRPADAEAPLRAAVQASWGFGAPWSSYRAQALATLAHCVFAQGRSADARALVDDALVLTKPGSSTNDQRISELETLRAEAFRSEQRPELAVPSFKKAIEASARHPAELAPALIVISLRLAETLQGLGQHQDAVNVLQRALAVAQREPAGHALTARVTLALAPPNSAPSPAVVAGDASAIAGSAAQEVVAMQADFRACYRASLANDGDVQGRVELVIRIAADGRVVNVKADGAGLPAPTIDCLLRRASLAKFEPPQGGSAVITVPVTFVKQEND